MLPVYVDNDQSVYIVGGLQGKYDSSLDLVFETGEVEFIMAEILLYHDIIS